MLKIAMLSTGEEVLHGDILDSNAAWLSRLFYQNGLSISKRSTVGDQLSALTNELLNLSFNHDIVIVNGGLGPTSDDITAQAIADAAGEPLVLFDSWVAKMESMFKQSSRKMPESNLKQAMLPESAELIDNPVGTACGFSVKFNDTWFFFTPGVPREFKIMVEQQILPTLVASYSQIAPSEVSRMYTMGLSESGISDLLDNLTLPDGFELGYRSYIPFIEVKLFGPQNEQQKRLSLLKIIYAHLGDNVVSIDEEMLSNIGGLITDSGSKVSISEVATGGHLTSLFTGNEKTDNNLVQGWVLNNANHIDIADNDPLASALALAAAIKEKTDADIGLSVGKLIENQVAVALSSDAGEWGQVISLKRKYDRQDQRELIAYLTLDMLRRMQENKPIFGQYSSIIREKELFIPGAILSD